MSNLKTETVTLLAEVEEKLEELLRATPAQDYTRSTRLAGLLLQARRIRQGWDTRWVAIEKLVAAHELEEQRASERRRPIQ